MGCLCNMYFLLLCCVCIDITQRYVYQHKNSMRGIYITHNKREFHVVILGLKSINVKTMKDRLETTCTKRPKPAYSDQNTLSVLGALANNLSISVYEICTNVNSHTNQCLQSSE